MDQPCRPSSPLDPKDLQCSRAGINGQSGARLSKGKDEGKEVDSYFSPGTIVFLDMIRRVKTNR